MDDKVKVWEEDVRIPTYGTGQPEKNPMFLEKRVYQGSSGVVYPYPVVEKIEDVCEDKIYRAVWLENAYIRVMILPELGGRVQMAYDKLKERHFIYYNHVVKPALVGLTGPWISGGIEFNWPQHHRPSTFLPVDYCTEQLPDGGVAVWVSERERMFGQKGTAGFLLRPARAVLEIRGKVSNPTPLPQTFLWWANPAVAVNEHYQSVFPADVNAVFDHGKRDVSRYPIATGVYYKMDYSAGVDISRYKNIPVPTSYMAIQSKYDFVGGYENDTRAGVLHVANHHISPGKKQWTWGNGDFGQAWDRNLTDADGPYIELMTGVYTDNQPDFTWLQPYEEKTFTQYFMPYRELGVVKNASADLLMNLEEAEGGARLKVFATSLQQGLHITVCQDGSAVYDTVCDLSPEQVWDVLLPSVSTERARVSICDVHGREILGWMSESDDCREVPEAATPAPDPKEIRTVEELYLNGLHLEQYRHATYNPVDYYQEGLHRDPDDARCNNAMGLWLIRKGRFAAAEPYLRRAIRRLTLRNPNPYDGEPYYNLGLSLKYQRKNADAYAAFYKACWNAAWQDAGYYALAQLSVTDGRYADALEEIDKSLSRNAANMRARHLKALILRRLGRNEEALAHIDDTLRTDAFNFGCLWERGVLTGDPQEYGRLAALMSRGAPDYEMLVLDYASAGCFEEALQVTEFALARHLEESTLLYYYRCWCLIRLERTEEARRAVAEAEQCPAGCCFPNALEAIEVLQTVIAFAGTAPKACYYLGNLWYDKRQYDEAVAVWERSVAIDDRFPTVQRNLALAYFNKYGRVEEAVQLLERAYALDENDARVLMELDQLYKRLNRPHAERLAFLNRHMEILCKRDDLYLEYATLLNQSGRYDEAMKWIDARRFHPWEGGEGKVPAQYQIARLESARLLMDAGQYDEALRRIDECFVYPDHLGEGKLQGAQENDFMYYKACLLRLMGRRDEALRCFELASHGLTEPAAAVYYNDQKPDKIYYRGLALRELGRENEARGWFHKLVDYGEKHLADEFRMDYFAVSLPDLQIWEDDMDKKNRLHCYYLMALGYLGLGQNDKACRYFTEAVALDNNHQGVQMHSRWLIDYITDEGRHEDK